MRTRILILAALFVLSLVTGCSRGEEAATALPTDAAQSGSDGAPVCPAARGVGTVPPGVSIYSITFTVNGVDQVVRGDDALQASPGDDVQVREVTLCAEPFSGDGGAACADFAPADPNGEEIVSEHAGSHLVQVTSGGFISIPGPDYTWTIREDWGYISAVVNHWPPGDTEDMGCAAGQCERDDRILIEIQ